MAWDDEKDTFRQRSDVPPDEKLTASEWNAHVTDQENHSGRHEDGGSDELSVDGLSGVLADAQTPQTEAVEDIVGALLAGGTNISLTYDDANDVLTIDTSALNEEEVEDAVAALVTAGGGITVNYDDDAGTLSIAVDESALSFYDGTNLTAPVDNQSVTTEDAHNKRYYTVDGDSLTDIQAALDDGYDFLKLRPGQTYSGSDNVEINPKGRNIHIDSRSASLSYSGSGPMVDILENHSNDFEGQVHWEGGSVSGDGSNHFLRITDSFNHKVEIDDASDFGRVFWIRNVDSWSELNRVVAGKIRASCDYGVYAEGASATGGSGTDSMRGTQIDIFARNCPESAIYQDHAWFYGSRVYLQAIVQEGANAWEMDLPDGPANRGCYAHVDIEGEGDGIVATEIAQPPVLIDPWFTGPHDDDFILPDNEAMPRIDFDPDGFGIYDQTELLAKFRYDEIFRVFQELEVIDNDLTVQSGRLIVEDGTGTTVYRVGQNGAAEIHGGFDTGSAIEFKDGLQMPATGTEPSDPTIGQIAFSNGSGWDPDGDGNGELVFWSGSSWVEIADAGTSY